MVVGAIFSRMDEIPLIFVVTTSLEGISTWASTNKLKVRKNWKNPFSSSEHHTMGSFGFITSILCYSLLDNALPRVRYPKENDSNEIRNIKLDFRSLLKDMWVFTFFCQVQVHNAFILLIPKYIPTYIFFDVTEMIVLLLQKKFFFLFSLLPIDNLDAGNSFFSWLKECVFLTTTIHLPNLLDKIPTCLH